MRTDSFAEKRRFKRLDLSLPVRLKRILNDGKEEVVDTFTSNVSYTGAYVSEVSLKDVNPEDSLQVSLSVPREDTRDFPFSRFTGKARVIRVEKNDIALEFSEDISRLCVAI